MTQSTDELRAERDRINAALRAAERAQKTRERLIGDPPANVRAEAWSLLFAKTSDEGRTAMLQALAEAVDADIAKRRKRTEKARATRHRSEAPQDSAGSVVGDSEQVEDGGRDDAVE